MPALYTALAIFGWVSFCALIAWFVGRVLDYAAQLFQEEADQFADAWGDVPALHEEMRTGQRIGFYRATANPSGTLHTHSFSLSGPRNGAGRL
jgi:hypothetical protein